MSSHYLRDLLWTGREELKEREDDERRWEHDFGTTQLADEDERDRQFRTGGNGDLED